MQPNGFTAGSKWSASQNGHVRSIFVQSSCRAAWSGDVCGASETEDRQGGCCDIAYGATLANIQAFGRNYALNRDPTSQSFSGYNHDNYKTDFEYLGIRSDLGNGLTVDNKVYTTSYYQNSYHGADVGGQGPNLLGLYYVNGVTPANLSRDVPSFSSKYYFRNTGDVLRLAQDTKYGQIRLGVWAEHELFATNTFAADATRGFLPYTATPGSIFVNRYRSNLDTLQPYVEFAWKPLSNDKAAVAAARAAHYPSPPAEIGDRLLRFLVWVEFKSS